MVWVRLTQMCYQKPLIYLSLFSEKKTYLKCVSASVSHHFLFNSFTLLFTCVINMHKSWLYWRLTKVEIFEASTWFCSLHRKSWSVQSTERREWCHALSNPKQTWLHEDLFRSFVYYWLHQPHQHMLSVDDSISCGVSFQKKTIISSSSPACCTDSFHY